MPRSCNVVWDVLWAKAGAEAITLSIRELAEICRLSERQTRRALRRLQGAHLIRWTTSGPGRGHRSVFEVRWESFPQKKGASLQAARNPEQSCKNTSRKDSQGFEVKSNRSDVGASSPCTCLGRPVTQVGLNWALGTLRAELRSWGIGPEPRANLMAALGPALYRAVKAGHLTTGKELGLVVQTLLDRLGGGYEGSLREITTRAPGSCTLGPIGWSDRPWPRSPSNGKGKRPRSGRTRRCAWPRRRREELGRIPRSWPRWRRPWLRPFPRSGFARGKGAAERPRVLSTP